MQERTNVELLNEFPTLEFPITTTIPERVSEEVPMRVNRVDLGFIIAYAAAFALFGALSIQPMKGVR